MDYMKGRGFTPENGRIVVSLRPGPYHRRTPGDSPELMPLDSHLFSDFKFEVRRYAMRWPGTFSRSTPDRLWALMVAAWESGMAPTDARVAEDVGNWARNIKWVVAAGGKVVPELNPRHGRRLAKRRDRKKQTRKVPVRKLPALATLVASMPASTTPQEPLHDVLPIAAAPTAAAIDAFGRAELRRRCGLLSLAATGDAGVLRARLKVYFGLVGEVAAGGGAAQALLDILDEDSEEEEEEQQAEGAEGAAPMEAEEEGEMDGQEAGEELDLDGVGWGRGCRRARGRGP